MAAPITAPITGNDMAILQRALGMLQSGAAAGAEQLLRGLSPGARQHPDALYLMAIAAEGQGRAADARARYEAALRAAPGNAGIWTSYGNFLDGGGDADAAISAYGRAVAIAPGHFDAWLNMGIAAIAAKRWDAAADALARALQLAPNDGRVLGVIGTLEQGRGAHDAAAAAFGRALAINPRDVRARHNLAISLRATGAHQAALDAIEQAMRDGLTATETAILRGHTLADLGRFDDAAAQYRAVIAAVPGQIDAHQSLALLLPQIGRKAEALDGYAGALRKPADRALWMSAIGAARAVGDAAQMLEWADAAAAAHGPDPHWTLARVGALTLLGEPAAAIAAALAADAGSSAIQNYLGYLYLQTGDLPLAERHALAATRLAPAEQSPWALLTVIWRLMGDAREQWLADYDRLVMAAEIPVPPGWRDLPAFLGDLQTVLTGLHTTMLAPAEQSLRGGTQTRGALFDSVDPVLGALKTALIQTVDRCIADLPRDPTHPFLGRRDGGVDIAGSWSVRLRGQGFHISHIHPSGWLSSAFYVAVPPEVAADGPGGNLVFGVPETALGLDLAPRRVVVPVPGRLVLFPSYVWHGTVPFESAAPRLTVAFDALPRP